MANDDNILEIQTRVNSAGIKSGMKESVAAVESGANSIAAAYRKLAEDTINSATAQSQLRQTIKEMSMIGVENAQAITIMSEALQANDQASAQLRSTKEALTAAIQAEAEAALASSAAGTEGETAFAQATEASGVAMDEASIAAINLQAAREALGLTDEKIIALQAKQAAASLVAAEAAAQESRAVELAALKADISSRLSAEVAAEAAAAKRALSVANIEYRQTVQNNVAAEAEEMAVREAELTALREDILARAELNEAYFGNAAGAVEFTEALGVETAALEKSSVSTRNATASAFLLRQELGIEMPRAMGAIIRELPILGAALEAAFPILIAVTFLSILGDIVGKMYEWISSTYTQADAWKFLYANINKGGDEIVKLNAETIRLEHQAALLNDHMGTLKEDVQKVNDNVAAGTAAVEKTNAALRVQQQEYQRLQQINNSASSVKVDTESVRINIATLSLKAQLQKAELEKEQAQQVEAYAKLEDAEKRAAEESARKSEQAARRRAEAEKKANAEVERLLKQSTRFFAEAGAEYDKETKKKTEFELDALVTQSKAELKASDDAIEAFHKELLAAEDADNQQVKSAQKAYTQKKLYIEDEVTNYQIKATERGALLQKAADEEYQIALHALQNKYLLQDLDPDNPDKKRKTLDEIEQLSQQHATRIAEINRQQTQATQKVWDGYFNHLTQGITTSINGWIQGTQTFQQAMGKMFSSILVSEIEYYAESKIRDGVHWLEKSIQQKVGLAEQQATQSAAAGVSAATTGATNSSAVLSEAALAGAAAFASTAAIPIIGPALAPEAAATAYSATAAFAPLAFFEQGGITGADGMAFLHKKEMVLPQDIAGGLQTMISSGGQGEVHNHFGGNHYTAIDSEGMEGLLSQHEDHIGAIVKGQLRSGKMGG